MNIGKKFFKHIKIVNILVCIFLTIVLVPAMVMNICEGKWKIVLLCILAIEMGGGIILFLFRHYQNMVIGVHLVNGETVEIVTNKEIFRYKIGQVSKIEKESGRICIYCCGEKGERKFTYQTIYFVKEHMPDIKSWKRKLIYTTFVGFDE